jgi:uncharacterized membrane protein (DUF2068 family)
MNAVRCRFNQTDTSRRMSTRPSLLPWIIAFKVFKTITLIAVGVTLLVARHHDPVDILLRVALMVHFPLTSRLLDRLITSVSQLTLAKETALALTAFAYAGLMGSEAVSLYLRKPWARWFTIIATSSLMPVEVYEIAREVHPVRVVVLIANFAIVVYLVKRKDVFE